jgi:hypothetical protein
MALLMTHAGINTPYWVWKNNLAHLYWYSEILTNKTVFHNHPDMTLFEKTNKIVYLTAFSIPYVGNLQTAYTKIMRKYALKWNNSGK